MGPYCNYIYSGIGGLSLLYFLKVFYVIILFLFWVLLKFTHFKIWVRNVSGITTVKIRNILKLWGTLQNILLIYNIFCAIQKCMIAWAQHPHHKKYKIVSYIFLSGFSFLELRLFFCDPSWLSLIFWEWSLFNLLISG